VTRRGRCRKGRPCRHDDGYGPALRRELLRALEGMASSLAPLPERVAAALAALAPHLSEERVGGLPPGLLVQVREFRDRPPRDAGEFVLALSCLADQAAWWCPTVGLASRP
jgi:hypothetical protein